MNADRIRELHEQASEKYLNGDYQGAIDAWREVAHLDPQDEQAENGIRMASQFVAAPEPHAEAAAPPVVGPGADGETDLKPAANVAVIEGLEDMLEGWDVAPEAAAAESSFGLEPVARAAAPVSAAAAELNRRVSDLLNEAKAKADAGERDEALAILSRLAILDEDNEEADALRAKLESQSALSHEQMEQLIVEGVAAFEADRLDEAEQNFRKVLEHSPEHKEAQHYLEKIEAKRSGSSDEIELGLGVDPHPAPPAPAAPAPPQADELLPPVVQPRAHSTAPIEHETMVPPPAVQRPKLAMPSGRKLAYAGGAVALLVVGALVVPRFFGKSAPAPAPQKGGGGAVWSAPKGKRNAIKGTAPEPTMPATPEEREKLIKQDLDVAESRMAAGDYGAAVIAYNDALRFDSANPAAKSGLAAAGERYKASKAERDALANIKLAFRDGEFTSGLRLAYRLPPTVAKSYVDNIKVTGWYNLAVVALRAGECKDAESHLDEALQIAPGDIEAKKLRELAARYADAVKDRSFLDRVEALNFRELPS